ncbi:30S ribosomal protein S8 [candidate division KSB1 bacterium]|nr:30S ribosomal protein S8 [candidate division KSB1 bacterium]
MSKSDPIADYLTRIRNALRAKHKKVDIPASNLKREITKILHEERYINNYVIIEDNKQSLIRIYLRYDQEDRCVISGIKRISRPGLRKYVSHNSIPRVYNNLGVSIITTSQGVMTGQEAKKRGVGGEVLCHVW